MTTLKELAPLFVFEMANNHMGNPDHGLRIIKEFSEVTKEFPSFSFGFKLQYRNLDTFIHPHYRDRMDVKYVKRFSETRVAKDDLQRLKDEMVRYRFVTVCTPFDEESVDLIEEHGFDVIKIASCSFTDWPLLERIAMARKPVIASTAGVPLEDIDKVVSFFDHRGKEFALMHCVALYPTPRSGLQLNQIDFLRQRYQQTMVGYSTHEDPDEFEAITIAVAKGAAIFEKHVGVPTEEWPLNSYSSTPAQTRNWLHKASDAFEMCGTSARRPDFTADEIASLHSLRRGVFAARPFIKGEHVAVSDVFYAMPTVDGQITANDMSKYTEFTTRSDVADAAPLLKSNTSAEEHREKVYKAVQEIKVLLQKSGVVVPPKVDLEISHHYGIDNFKEFGLTMLTIVNREYCKKLIILLPGQRHPEQYHKAKEETFHVLYGDVQLDLNGATKECTAGEVVVVERGTKHAFGSAGGAIIEEISSTHYPNDSFYTDPRVTQNGQRKTLLTYWVN